VQFLQQKIQLGIARPAFNVSNVFELCFENILKVDPAAIDQRCGLVRI